MMSVIEYIDTLKDTYNAIHHFLDNEAKSEEKFQILKVSYNNTKIKYNQYYLYTLLHFISKIGNHHHRSPNFFAKIERLLIFFKEDIKKYFTNSVVFNIFRSNKRILLFLVEQQIIVIDEYIVRKITKTCKYIEAKYPQYFQPEIQPFINEKWFPKYDPKHNLNGWVEEMKKELPENFYEKRKEGENDSLISELIRKDMITEFVEYVSRNNVSPNAKIQSSIYETNSFLLKIQKESHNFEDKQPTLIEYAVFSGSIQIFNYLRLNGAELTSSLWRFAIHGQNSEIFHFLEDNYVELEDTSYFQIFLESIKCHHNDFANYFINNFFIYYGKDCEDTLNQSLKYHNFAFFEKESIQDSTFSKMFKYDHCAIIDTFLEMNVIDVNQKEILNYLINIILADDNLFTLKILFFNSIQNHNFQ